MKGHDHEHHKGCSHGASEPLSDFTLRLRQGARKITGPRQAILEVMRRQRSPLTTREVLAALPTGVCDLATVYRSMHLLQKMGMVKRFDFGDGTARFELLGEGDDGHHHHLICRECERVVEIDDCFPPELEKRLAQTHGFTQVNHKLEFFGLCPGCQSSGG